MLTSHAYSSHRVTHEPPATMSRITPPVASAASAVTPQA